MLQLKWYILIWSNELNQKINSIRITFSHIIRSSSSTAFGCMDHTTALMKNELRPQARRKPRTWLVAQITSSLDLQEEQFFTLRQSEHIFPGRLDDPSHGRSWCRERHLAPRQVPWRRAAGSCAGVGRQRDGEKVGGGGVRGEVCGGIAVIEGEDGRRGWWRGGGEAPEAKQ
jgi:hypothetical protein